MSVATANVFALLDDEGTVDAGELAAKLPVASKEPVKKATVETKQAPSRGSTGRGADVKPRRATGGDDAPALNGEGAPAARDQSSRGGARSSRGRPRADGDRRKREFDRHDASGRGHEIEKRQGQGRGNWGAEGEAGNEDLEKKVVQEGDAEAEPAEAEAEEKQLSLEEYEALVAEKKAALNAVREPAVQVDEKQFEGMRTFAKVEDDAGLALSKNTKTIGSTKAGRDKERKEREVLTDVGFRVANADTGRGRGGGRGGRREGRGRKEGGRGGRGGRGTSIRIEDTNAFPSLG